MLSETCWVHTFIIRSNTPLLRLNRFGPETAMANSVADEEHPRLILHNFISPEECKELEFIHKSCSTVGYRPNVFSTTLSHLIATNSAHLIMPFVAIRERLKEKAEEFFGCEYELCIEFTGLISWCRGASIGWHSDDNRHYLKQRDFTAVCYLNSYGEDFRGGLFHFKDGEPKSISPVVGDVIMYTADSRNIHSVDEVTEGERLTLTLWFSRDSSHDEDIKFLSSLSQYLPCNSNDMLHSCLPLPASSNMYWLTPEQAIHQESGFNICLARIQVLGYDVYCPQDMSSLSDISELFMGPLQLAKKDELFNQGFINILHALQVLQFSCWKSSDLLSSRVKAKASNASQLLPTQLELIRNLNSTYVQDQKLVETVFGFVSCKEKEKEKHSFDWDYVSAAINAWEEYSCKLYTTLLKCLPNWRTHMSIYGVPSEYT